MSGSLAGRTATKEFEKGRTELTKVRRYWAGKAPEWVQETEEDVLLPQDVAPEDDAERTATFVEPVVVRPAADSRLARLQQYKSIDREEGYARHREVAAPEVVKRSRDDDEDGDDIRAARRARRHPQEEEEEAAAESSSSEEDEDESGDERDEDGEDPEEAEARRKRLRQALLERQQQQEREEAEHKRQAAEEAAHQRQESDEDEYETDSEEEDEEEDDAKLLKPVFVPKNQRDTVLEREQMVQEEEELQKREAERKLERKEETRQLVGEIVKLEQEAKKGLADTPALLEDIDTDDEGGDEDADFEAWRQRELARVRRERSARERLDREAAERERLKTMTPAERAEWERLHPKVPAAKAPKSKWKFLQKYWHRGAYFQNEADDDRATVGGDTIFKRDYSGATGEDKFDKSMLPAVMQVRNFGRSGRTKWKHLVAEDTTNWEDPWVNDSKLRSKYTQKMAGMVQDFKKPKSHRT